MRTPTHAVVLGAGSAGTLAAAVLTRHVDRVTLIDRDTVPDGPGPRTGIPQARHVHMLWSGGARTFEQLLPGITERWLAAGAHHRAVPGDIVLLTRWGWVRRWPGMQFMIAASRDLLDWVVRERLLSDTGIDLRTRTQAVGLTGDAGRVTGVRLLDRADGTVTALPADLVVDTTGRGSRAVGWLTELGSPPAKEEIVDSGLAYATRIFRAPQTAGEGFPLISVQPDAPSAGPGRSATLMPIEDRRWLVTVSGTRGGEPPTDDEGFLRFAREVRHPLVAELIADAEPLGPVHGSRSTVNRRRFFERVRQWPEGFLVLGDAVATYNPVYGQGMTVAAHGAAALDRHLTRHGLRPGTAPAVQRAIGRTVGGAWTTATSQDVCYPDAVGPRPTAVVRLLQAYVDRMVHTSTSRPAAAGAFLDAVTLSAPMTRLLAPRALLATLRGPGLPPLTEPPLTGEEARLLPRHG